jgi:DNA-binding HxlR family transcriptional regulator
MDLLGRRYALCIIWALQKERPKRFGDIKKDLDLNATTLSQRLKEFELAGLVTRTTHDQIPPRVDYDLTPKGLDLLPIMDTLDSWSAKWTITSEPEVST